MDIDKKTLRELQKIHKTDANIARVVGVTRPWISYLRKKFKIPSSRSKNKERDSRMRNDFNEKMSGIDIARKYKLSTAQTYKILKGDKVEVN